MGADVGGLAFVRKVGTPPFAIWGVILSFVGSMVYFGMVPLWSSLLVFSVLCEGTSMVMDLLQRERRILRASNMPAPKNEGKQYTWEEVAQHNDAESAWIAIRGKVYDVTTFLDRHPGGFELLLLCCGRDATDLFISYHPFTKVPEQVLKKFEIGTVLTYEHATYREDSGFYAECSQRIKEYFEKNKIDPKDPLLMTKRMIPVYVVGSIVFYIAFLSQDTYSWTVRILAALAFGVCQGLPLTGWMHDASHASIGHNETWWFGVGRISLDWVSGSSMLSWRNQHVIGHHVYTNVFGADPDLPTEREGDFRRISENQFWAKLYKYQHFYVPPLYGLLAIKARLQDFFEIFARHTNGPIRVNPISSQDYLRLGASKSFWMWYRLIVPYAFFGCSMTDLALLSFVTDLVVGYWLAFNFQVSHVSTECDFLDGGEEGAKTNFADEWAMLQVKTSVDYSHGNPIATYLSGALNYQTAHHLFPTVSQAHYMAITPMILDVCEKYKVKYNVLPDYASAIKAHVLHLKQMGIEGKAPELKLE